MNTNEMLGTADITDILTPYQAAKLLDCEPKTVEEALRTGNLPGLKMGRGWVLPRQAFMEAVNDIARRNLGVKTTAPPIAFLQATLRGKKRSGKPSPIQETSP